MDRAQKGTGRRVLRVLLASGFLALGWVAIDTVMHATPAAAAETIDLVPLVDDTLDSVISTVEPVVSPVVAPVVTTVTEPVEPIVSAVVAEVVSPVVTQVVTPVVEPILEATAPIVAPIVAPLVDAIDEVTPVLPAMNASLGQQLIADGALVVGSIVAASLAPLLPLPANGTPRNAPAEPTGAGSASLLAIYGELNSGIQAAWSALRAGPVLGDVLPSSPTFAFDTTPD